MLSKILETEGELDALLPQRRLQQSPPANLLAAATAWSQAVWAIAQDLGPMPLSVTEIAQGRNLSVHPVFICGVHRSGTTLVRDILDGHPDVVVLPSEGTYYTNLECKLKALPDKEWAAYLGKEWLKRLANPINQPPYWLLGRSSDAVSPYVNFARYLLAWWQLLDHKTNTQWPHMAIVLAYASATGNLKANLWADKTPANERFLNRIWHEMPQAKVIQVIREPLAIVSSRKKMEPLFNIRSVLKDLKMSFRTAVKQSGLNDPQFLLLRYEELCEKPAAGIDKLAAFLNISASSALNQPTVAGRPAQANSSFNPETTAGQILKPDEHARQEILNIPERELLTAYTGRLTKKLNYPVAYTGYLNGLYLRLKHRLL